MQPPPPINKTKHDFKLLKTKTFYVSRNIKDNEQIIQLQTERNSLGENIMEVLKWLLVVQSLSFFKCHFVAAIGEFRGNTTGPTASSDRASSLLREVLQKQDMTQAMLLMNNILQVMADVQSLKDDVRQLHTENIDLRRQLFSGKTRGRRVFNLFGYF